MRVSLQEVPGFFEGGKASTQQDEGIAFGCKAYGHGTPDA
jgi:hypothetical protein